MPSLIYYNNEQFKKQSLQTQILFIGAMRKWIYSLQFNFPFSETLSYLSSSSHFWAKFPIIKQIINEDEIYHA